jgi:hypothetical protein
MLNKFDDVDFATVKAMVEEATAPNQGMDLNAKASEFEALDAKSRSVRFGNSLFLLEEKAAKDLYIKAGGPYFPERAAKPLDQALMESELFAPHWASVLNTGMHALSDKVGSLFVRGARGKDGNVYARKVFSSRVYKPFDGMDILEVADHYRVSLPNVVFKHVSAGRDYTGIDMYFNGLDETLLPAELQGHYRVGIRIATGEIGNAATSLRPCVWRTQCQNSFALRAGGVNVRALYTKNTVHRLFAETVNNTFRFGAALVHEIEESKGFPIPDLDDVLWGFCAVKGFGKKVYETARQGTEGSRTLFGIINGITHAAKTQEPVLADQMQTKAVDALFNRMRQNKEEEGSVYTWDMTALTREEMVERVDHWRSFSDRKLKEETIADDLND